MRKTFADDGAPTAPIFSSGMNRPPLANKFETALRSQLWTAIRWQALGFWVVYEKFSKKTDHD